jgi:hypothetical protein
MRVSSVSGTEKLGVRTIDSVTKAEAFAPKIGPELAGKGAR